MTPILQKKQATTATYDINALDPAASVFVSANAGAGKTSLLAARALSLLLAGTPPSKILCLTFTKPAAAEMSARILKALGEWVMAEEAALSRSLALLLGHDPDDVMLARARGLFAAVLEDGTGIRIQTIHGFCQSLLARFPLEAGIRPHFQVMDSRSEQELLAEAKTRLFAAARSGENTGMAGAMAGMAPALSETSFSDLLKEIVQNKRKFRQLFDRPGGLDSVLEEMWQRLDSAPDAVPEALITKYFNYADDEIAQLQKICATLLAGGKTDAKSGQGLERWLLLAARAPSDAKDYAGIFLRVDGEKKDTRKIFSKATLDENQKVFFLGEQERVLRYHQACRALETGGRTARLLHVAEALLSIYNEMKDTRARMDYDDLILTACDLLEKRGMAEWVLFKLDGGIDHVLVDEAQDTSPEQWRIIDALTTEFFSGQGRADGDRSLFVVGDEKQSIFSFQGADVAELAKMHGYFTRRIGEAAKPVHAIALTRSFRSAPEVLKAVDAVFAQPAARAGLMSGEGALTHIPTRPGPGVVELWPLLTSEEGEAPPASRLARRLAETIAGWIARGEARPGEVMILLRTRAGLADRLVRALKRRRVPVAGIDRMRLSANLAVQDLLALGQCLLLPEDDLTLAALLKSPLFDVSEDDLFRLAWDRGKTSLWERLGQDAASAKAYALLAELRARADFVSPYELYAHALDTLGGRARMLGRMGMEYADPIDEFLAQALLYERGHTPSLQGFLHWLTGSESEIKRDMEQAADAVRVMTVHAAKGLQSRIVILADTVETPKQREALLWHEEGLPLWPVSRDNDDSLSRRLRAGRKEAALAEHRRLLYVALTRAEERLYICGATGHEGAGENSWHHLVRTGLSASAEPLVMDIGEGLRISSPHRGEEGRGASDERSLDSCPPPTLPPAGGGTEFSFLHATPPPEPLPTQPLSPSRPEGAEPAAAPPSDKALYRRGALIHLLLQHLPGIAPNERARVAGRLGADEEMLREALGVMNDPACAFLFAEGSLAEVPVAGVIEMKGEPVSVAGQIDRLHVGEREVWIADFKSHRLPPDAPPPAYLRQMALYRLLLSRIYPQKEVRCALVWTAVPRVDLLDEAALSSYI